MYVRGNVIRVTVRRRKILSGRCPFRELSFGELSVGEKSVNVPVGETIRIPCINFFSKKISELACFLSFQWRHSIYKTSFIKTMVEEGNKEDIKMKKMKVVSTT